MSRPINELLERSLREEARRQQVRGEYLRACAQGTLTAVAVVVTTAVLTAAIAGINCWLRH